MTLRSRAFPDYAGLSFEKFRVAAPLPSVVDAVLYKEYKQQLCENYNKVYMY